MSNKEVEASEFNFSVDLEIPDNQIDKEKTYLDLLMEAGKEQNIPFTLYNDTSKDVTVETVIHSATTNSNGVIEYGISASKIDESLVYNMADLATTDKEIVIPAQGSITKILKIKAPKQKFSGVVAGGITFQEKADAATQSSEKTVGIVNRFSQVKAILIRNTEDEVLPDLVLKKAYADQSNVRNVIAVNIQNPNPAYMFDLNTTINVYKKGKADPYLTLKKEKINVAPNTNFNLNIPLKGKKLEAGDYHIVVDASWKKKTWKLETDFKISADKAKELNDKDIDLQSEPDNNYQTIIIIVLSSIIVLLVILFIIRERRNRK
ncbi:DUF3324 domain-containing protein [Erwinia sp. CPCC 100877]|nr:DUF3324 domain-containing protein [Erwinia sp. CPCC 100877]